MPKDQVPSLGLFSWPYFLVQIFSLGIPSCNALNFRVQCISMHLKLVISWRTRDFIIRCRRCAAEQPQARLLGSAQREFWIFFLCFIALLYFCIFALLYFRILVFLYRFFVLLYFCIFFFLYFCFSIYLHYFVFWYSCIFILLHLYFCVFLCICLSFVLHISIFLYICLYFGISIVLYFCIFVFMYLLMCSWTAQGATAWFGSKRVRVVGAGGDRWQLMERDKINQRKIIIRKREKEMEISIISHLKNRRI